MKKSKSLSKTHGEIKSQQSKRSKSKSASNKPRKAQNLNKSQMSATKSVKSAGKSHRSAKSGKSRHSSLKKSVESTQRRRLLNNNYDIMSEQVLQPIPVNSESLFSPDGPLSGFYVHTVE